jgi:small nuclear ribonucleoprotein (snRNP)-like protein
MLTPIEVLIILITTCVLTHILQTALNKKSKELNKELQNLRYIEGVFEGVDKTLNAAIEIAKEKKCSEFEPKDENHSAGDTNTKD